MIKLKDMECIISVSENGISYILQRSELIKNTNLLVEELTEDNNFSPDTWDENLDLGVYKVTLKPWGYQDYQGEYEVGLDVVQVEKLWPKPSPFAFLLDPPKHKIKTGSPSDGRRGPKK